MTGATPPPPPPPPPPAIARSHPCPLPAKPYRYEGKKLFLNLPIF